MTVELIDKLEKLNPDAALLEPRSVYDTALVDVTDDPRDQWIREDRVWVAVYNESVCIEAIMSWLGCTEAGARDWFCTKTINEWVGEGTPTFQWGHCE